MSILDNTNCHLLKRLKRKEVWNKRPYFSRNLPREVNGFTPACFPQEKTD